MDIHILDGLQILVLVPGECIRSFLCLFLKIRKLLLFRCFFYKNGQKLGITRETPAHRQIGI